MLADRITTLVILLLLAGFARADPKLIQIADEAARSYKMAPSLLKAICATESNWNAKAVGDDGRSIGVCQIQVSTVRKFFGKKVSNIQIRKYLFDATVNIYLAAKLMSDYLSICEGDETCAIIAYNAGPNAWVLQHYRKVRIAQRRYQW